MAQYNLNISHNNLNENITYSEAINLLNEYEYHRVGQPIAIVYYDENNERQLMLAIGKRDYTDPIGGKSKGEGFYELINKNELADGNSHFMVIKNGDVYIRGIDSTDSIHDYKILNRKCIIEQVEDTDIVTMGYLSEWGAFQNIE
jgi:hypothetical protein